MLLDNGSGGIKHLELNPSNTIAINYTWRLRILATLKRALQPNKASKIAA